LLNALVKLDKASSFLLQTASEPFSRSKDPYRDFSPMEVSINFGSEMGQVIENNLYISLMRGMSDCFAGGIPGAVYGGDLNIG